MKLFIKDLKIMGAGTG